MASKIRNRKNKRLSRSNAQRMRRRCLVETLESRQLLAVDTAPTIQIVADANDDGFLNNTEFGGLSPQANRFEDGTTQGWQHGAVSTNPPSNIDNLGPAGPEDNVLHFEGHGNGDAVDLTASRLAAFNRTQWVGNYIEQGIEELTLDINNTGSRDLDLRLGIGRSPGSGRWVTPAQRLPVGSGWTSLTFSFRPDDLIGLIPGNDDPIVDLENVGVLKFIENVAPVWSSTPAENVPGRTAVEIDNILQSGTDRTTTIEARVDFPPAAVAGERLLVSDESSTQEIVLSPQNIIDGSLSFTFATPGEGHLLNLSARLADDQGNQSPVATDTVEIITVLPEASVSLTDNVTADNIIDIVETQQTIAITGIVGDDAAIGDAVEIAVNDKTFAGTVASIDNALGFSIDVPGADLAGDLDTTLEVTLTVVDAVGNSTSANDSVQYSVDLRPLPAIVISQTDDTTSVTENATSDTIEISLSREPSDDVLVLLSGVDATEYMIDTPSILFRPSNWQQPQTITITGVDDLVPDGNVSSQLTFSIDVGSPATEFTSVTPSAIDILTLDNDLQTEESGGGEAMNLRQPTLALTYIIATQGFTPNEAAGGFGDGTMPAVGEVRLHAGATVPAGFAVAEGQIMNISDNPALASILGDTFGGDGSQTFALPDLRGRVPIGADPAGGLAIGTTTGNADTQLSVAQLPSHSHGLQSPAVGQTIATGIAQPLDITGPSLALNFIVNVGGTSDLIGEARWFAGDFVPGDWLPGEGQTLSVTDESDLFAEIGTTFGGDGSTTFMLPDLRGRAIAGTGVGNGLTERQIGDTFGSTDTQITESQLPAHTHDYSIGGTTESQGTGEAISLLQPSLALNYTVDATGDHGTVNFSLSETVSPGHLPADGRSLDVAGNTTLSAALGNAFGGDGITDFALPDLRGRIGVHADAAQQLARGTAIGQEDISLTVDQLPSHAHNIGGIVIQETGGATQITENAAGDSFIVSLLNPPTNNVVLQIAAANSNLATVDTNALTFTPDNWSQPQTVNVLPTADGDQNTSIVVSVDATQSDDGYDAIAPISVSVEVNGVNDAPSFTFNDPPNTLEDAGTQTINGFATFDAGAASESGQSALQYAISNVNDSDLFDQLPSIDSAGNLTYTTAADANGTSTFEVTVQDDGGIANGGQDTSNPQTVTITVTAVNDAPQINAVDPPIVNEDSGFNSVQDWATFLSGPSDESSQSLVRFTISNISNPALFALPPEVDAAGNLTYTLPFNASGVSTFEIVAEDDGGVENGGSSVSSPRTFTLTVAEVNDQPIFSAANPPTVDQTDGPQTIENFITQFIPGPASENDQTPLEYIVSDISNATIFSELPAVTPGGTLTYTPSTSHSGTATFSLAVRDNGGTDRGGTDTSAAQTITITTREVDQFDFGDAADPPAQTRLANDGARHARSDLFLGASIDYEIDAVTNASADGDGDDEDGITLVSSLLVNNLQATGAALQISSVSASGKLDGWIDFNGNGNFDHPAEHLWQGSSIDVTPTTDLISFAIPAGTTAGDAVARFRLSSAGQLAPTGEASDGEVEDYLVTLVDEGTVTVQPSENSDATQIEQQGEFVVVRRDGVEVSRIPTASGAALRLLGSEQDDVFEVVNIDQTAFDLQILAGTGDDELRIVGANQVFDVRALSGNEASEIERVDLRGDGANRLILDAASVQAMSTTNNSLSILADADDTIDTGSESFLFTGTETVNNQLTTVAELGDATLRFESAGWTNSLNRFDSNNSGTVAPIDALIIINELGRRTFVIDDTTNLVAPGSLDSFPLRFYDVNGDQRLTPIDALQILNQIARNNGSPLGELLAGFADLEDDNDNERHALITDRVFASLG